MQIIPATFVDILDERREKQGVQGPNELED